ncbi:MAG: hypothetical protein ACNS60_15450 [Candidatus Cyclobacteriaceae bacterium M2_1C_046]
MRQLTQLQIDLIRGDIRQSGVEMRELEDDLLDHICCALEQEGNHSSFEEIYQEVKKSAFPEGYREIQQTTSYLLTLKYSTMKKTMNVLGITGSVMLLLGSIMKLQSMMGSNELLVLGGAILVFGYLPFMLTLSMKNSDTTPAKVRNISGYLGASAVIIGIIMSILHYAGGNTILITGFAIFLIIFLPLFLRSVGKDAVMKIHPVTSAVLILAVVSTLFAFNNKKTSHTYRHSLAEINNNISRSYESKKERLKELRAKSTDHRELTESSEEALTYIENLKKEIINHYGIKTDDLELREEFVIQDHQSVNKMLLENENGSKGDELYTKVKSFYSTLKNQHPELKSQLLNTEENKDWLKIHFENKPFFSVYTTLSQLQLEIADLEMEALRK